MTVEGHITNALKIAAVEMNRTPLFIEAQAQNLRSDVALATYLAYKMAEVKVTLLKSTNQFGYFKLTDECLKTVNTSLPCHKFCPLDMTTLINCNIEPKKNRLSILLRPNKTRGYILLNTRKRLKIFQFCKKYMKDPCPKNFPTLNFYYVILLKIGVNG